MSWPDYADAQSGLRMRSSHMAENEFSGDISK